MKATLIVDEPDDYQAWFAKQSPNSANADMMASYKKTSEQAGLGKGGSQGARAAAIEETGESPATPLASQSAIQDHKMIARQFLITGIFWAIIGGTLSSLFRLQLGWPEATLDWLQPFLGKWIEGGKLNPEFYLALVTMHGTIMV
nr:hypothetical protein [Tanacetum cinerariifolium]